MNIGVFDSGAGGKLVAEKIQEALPSANVILKADPEYFPYGNKSPEIILKRIALFTREFQKLGCAIVVIACNTATTNSISDLRKEFPDIQFVGVEPPVKPIVEMTKTGRVAVIGTEATIRSERLARLIKQFSKNVKIDAIACPGLAEFIETFVQPQQQSLRATERSLAISDDSEKQLLKEFLDKPISEGVDVVGIACTHYPYLLSEMKELYPNVTFYDPADAVVRRVIMKANDSMGTISN